MQTNKVIKNASPCVQDGNENSIVVCRYTLLFEIGNDIPSYTVLYHSTDRRKAVCRFQLLRGNRLQGKLQRLFVNLRNCYCTPTSMRQYTQLYVA